MRVEMEMVSMDKNVVWSPQPRQAAFMARPEWEAFYGGAAGGGRATCWWWKR